MPFYFIIVDEQDKDLKEVIQKEEEEMQEIQDKSSHEKTIVSISDEISLSPDNISIQEEARLITSSAECKYKKRLSQLFILFYLVKSGEWKRKVQKLSSTLGAKFPDNIAGQVQGIRAIANLICRRFKYGLWEEDKKESERDVEKLFSELNNGETCIDTNRIWCTLRLLNVAELETLQGEINDLLGVIQTFTANPKVNPSLGVIGK